MKKHLVIGLLLANAAAFAVAPKPSYYQQVNNLAPFSSEATSYKWTSDTDVRALKSSFSKSKRTPSNSSAGDESMMSEAFRQTRDRFLKIKTADELETFLVEFDVTFNDLKDNDQKFFVSQILPLKELRGIVWRSQPVFSQAKVTHSLVLTAIKSAVSQVKIFLPTDQWQAGLDYVTLPYVRNGLLSQPFKNEAELIAHTAGPVRAALLKAAQRIQKIDLKDQPIVWDNKLAFGTASFLDNIDRFRLVGEVERLSSLAAIHSTLAQITYQRAYSSENGIKLAQDMGKLYGVDGILSQVDGAPSQKRVQVLRRPAFANYGVLVEDGEKWMRLSFQHLQESVRLTSAIWSQIKTEDRPLTEAFVFDTSFARAYERGSDLAIANMEAMVAGRAKIRSGVTGETVVVDLPAFYQNPPKDLKEFLPTAFQQGPEWQTVNLTDGSGKVHKVKARNYEIGRGIDWKADAYGIIFPEMKSGKDVPRNVRILSQSWGTWITALPLADVIE